MNDKKPPVNDELLNYQTHRLKDLINEIVKCCEDRRLYESNIFGLTFAEIKCLLLFAGERYLTVKGISQKIDVAKSRVTKIIDGLLKKGYVERHLDPMDARVTLINLTRQGQQKTTEVEKFHAEIHRNILLQLAPEERKHMLSSLSVLRPAMEAVKSQFK